MAVPSDRSVWLARHILPHEPALRAWLRRRAVSGLEIDDIVQETYAVLAALASVDHITAPRAYAFQTAQSIILRHMRRGRIVRFETLGETNDASRPSEEASPEREASSREELRAVLRLIEGLPAKCREAFTLRRVAGLSQRDVARRMGISENTVEKHISRALRVLMEAFKDGGSPSARASNLAEQRDFRTHAGPREQQEH